MLASRFVVMVISIGFVTIAGCATNGSTTTVPTEARSAEATTGCPELGRADAARGTYDPQNESIDAALRVFVTAAGELANTANRVDAAAAGACERMGSDLQVPAANLRPERAAGPSRSAAICGTVATRLDGLLADPTMGPVSVSARIPNCTPSSDVESKCRAQCDARVDPDFIRSHCPAGQLTGHCDGTCSGTCNGSCNGTCRGRCGDLSGSQMCAGACDGRCEGQCDADCTGACSVEFQNPSCATKLADGQADRTCDPTCRAHAELTAHCTEPVVSVEPQPMNDGGRPLAVGLAQTLERNLPTLVLVDQAYAKRLEADADALGRVAADLSKRVDKSPAHAVSCVTAGANAVERAKLILASTGEASGAIASRVQIAR
jgi:hypothetical protein